MTSVKNEQIKASLACAHQLKTSVCRTAEEFKQLRVRLLQSLQVANAMQVGLVHIFIDVRINKARVLFRDKTVYHVQYQQPVRLNLLMKNTAEMIALKKYPTVQSISMLDRIILLSSFLDRILVGKHPSFNTSSASAISYQQTSIARLHVSSN